MEYLVEWDGEWDNTWVVHAHMTSRTRSMQRDMRHARQNARVATSFMEWLELDGRRMSRLQMNIDYGSYMAEGSSGYQLKMTNWMSTTLPRALQPNLDANMIFLRGLFRTDQATAQSEHGAEW